MKTTSTHTPLQPGHAGAVLRLLCLSGLFENLDIIGQLIYILQTKHVCDPLGKFIIQITTIKILFISMWWRIYVGVCAITCIEVRETSLEFILSFPFA